MTQDLDPNTTVACLEKAEQLSSVYCEVMRLTAASTAVRDVQHNTRLGSKILRAGNRVVIPYRQMLLDENTFGSDILSFKPDRFLQNPELAMNASYRPFGGGATYCPGRYLAKAEVLVFVALAISRFDIDIAEAGCSFPKMETSKPCLGIMGPQAGEDVMVVVRKTPEAEG